MKFLKKIFSPKDSKKNTQDTKEAIGAQASPNAQTPDKLQNSVPQDTNSSSAAFNQSHESTRNGTSEPQKNAELEESKSMVSMESSSAHTEIGAGAGDFMAVLNKANNDMEEKLLEEKREEEAHRAMEKHKEQLENTGKRAWKNLSLFTKTKKAFESKVNEHIKPLKIDTRRDMDMVIPQDIENAREALQFFRRILRKNESEGCVSAYDRINYITALDACAEYDEVCKEVDLLLKEFPERTEFYTYKAECMAKMNLDQVSNCELLQVLHKALENDKENTFENSLILAEQYSSQEEYGKVLDLMKDLEMKDGTFNVLYPNSSINQQCYHFLSANAHYQNNDSLLGETEMRKLSNLQVTDLPLPKADLYWGMTS